MSVSFGGFNSNAVTFKATESIENGCAVKISESNTVTPCANGDVFCGFVLNGENGYASVQLCGAVTSTYSGSAPKTGYEMLVSDGKGVKASADGREYLVVAVDENSQTVTFLM